MTAGFRSLLLALGLLLAARAAETPPPPAPASLEELRAQLEAHVTQARFAPALWGVKIESLDTGVVLFEHHADRRMSPASNAKLYTAALAFDVLHADYRIATPLYRTPAGDLIVRGRGDPSWNTPDDHPEFDKLLEPFVAAVKRAGISHFPGDVIADATFFLGVPNGAGWTADDLNDYYGAEVSALTLDDNYAQLRVSPGKTAGEPCTLALVQPHTGLALDNRTTTVAKGGARRIVARRIFDENVVRVFGQLPAGDKDEMVDVTVPRPAQWFAAALKAALEKNGIKVDGRARSLRWPDASPVDAKLEPFAEIQSPPLRELVRAFMKPSQNLETDLIFDHIGELQRRGSDDTVSSEDHAVRALNQFLQRAKLPADEVRFEEGSGLSRNDLTTANATVALLKYLHASMDAKDFLDALPVAGVDGTLKKRMIGTAAQGNVRAKTGSLRYANSLSGFVTTAAGEKLAFSLMLNRNLEPAGRNARDELDDIAVLLARFTGRSQPVVTAAK